MQEGIHLSVLTVVTRVTCTQWLRERNQASEDKVSGTDGGPAKMSESATLSDELRQLSAALKRVDQRLQAEPAPEQAALYEFRQSVDTARLTAWSVNELINARRYDKEPDTVLAFLSAERLRRLDQLVRNLCGDIDRGAITAENHGISSLSDAIKTLYEKLTRGIPGRPQGPAQPGFAAASNTRRY